MPEGDTIHRAAASLRAALAGKRLVRFDAPRLLPPLPQPGTTVDEVEARGKHLLIRFGDGLTLHTHMRMTGSWHLYGHGERWRKRTGAARVVLEVPDVVAVCFAAPVVEMLDRRGVARHPALRRLGPDLCLIDPDLDDAVERMAALVEPATPIGDALLDQRVASGIGNVYKCEVCFLHGVDPRTPTGQVAVDTRRALLATTSQLLQRNLTTGRRTTVRRAPEGTVYVYDRLGQPCRVCGTPIVAAPVGEQARITYWCPQCQPPGRSGSPPAGG
jgi:endonuclease VIII